MPAKKIVSTVIVIGLSVSILAFAFGGSPVTTVEANHGPPEWSNYTVNGVDPSDQHPGNSNSTYEWYTGVGLTHKGDWLVWRSEAVNLENCDITNIRSQAIDRRGPGSDGDDPGTQGDDDAAAYVKQSTLREDVVYIEWYDDSDLAQDAPRFHRKDEIVISFADCFENTNEPGWYQISVKYNGTSCTWHEDGTCTEDDGGFVSHKYDSHYFWICDCTSEAEAREKLGPPPSERTPTRTPTATPTAMATETGTPTATRTETATATAEATATVTRTMTASATRTETVTETRRVTTTDTPTERPTPTQTEPRNPGGTTAPGFGILGAVIGGIAALLYVYRHQREL